MCYVRRKHHVSKSAEWKGESAGGCNKENHPWRKNPHFILRMPKVSMKLIL